MNRQSGQRRILEEAGAHCLMLAEQTRDGLRALEPAMRETIESRLPQLQRPVKSIVYYVGELEDFPEFQIFGNEDPCADPEKSEYYGFLLYDERLEDALKKQKEALKQLFEIPIPHFETQDDVEYILRTGHEKPDLYEHFNILFKPVMDVLADWLTDCLSSEKIERLGYRHYLEFFPDDPIIYKLK